MFKEFAESFRAIKKRPGLFALNSLADFVFMLLFGMVYFFFVIGIMDNINSLSGAVTKDMLQNVQPADNIFGMLSQVPSLSPQIGFIASMLIYFILALFFVWVVMQSISWWLSFRINKVKINFFRHFATFALHSAVWWALFVLIVYVFFRISFHNILYEVAGSPITIITCVLLVLLSYFELASYSVHGRFKEMMKKLFNATIKKAHLMFLAYLIIIVLFAAAYFLSWGIFNLNTVAGLVAGILLTTLAITFSRIYLIKTLDKF
jgi:hypothetical protein